MIADGPNVNRLHKYIEVIRPLMDPLNQTNRLFIYLGTVPIKNLNYCLRRLGETFHVQVPTPTQVRKAGCVKVKLTEGTIITPF